MTYSVEECVFLYSIALTQWNDAIKNVSKDKGTPRKTASTYKAQREALEALQDAILAGEKRYWKRAGE